MNAFKNPRNSKLFCYIYLVAFCFSFTACTSKTKTEQKETKKTEIQDSISTWIANSSNKKYSREKRLEFLKNAYLKNKEQPIDTNATKTLSAISLNYSRLNFKRNTLKWIV